MQKKLYFGAQNHHCILFKPSEAPCVFGPFSLHTTCGLRGCHNAGQHCLRPWPTALGSFSDGPVRLCHVWQGGTWEGQEVAWSSYSSEICLKTYLRIIILESLVYLACLIMNLPSQPGSRKKGCLGMIIQRIFNFSDPNWLPFLKSSSLTLVCVEISFSEFFLMTGLQEGSEKRGEFGSPTRMFVVRRENAYDLVDELMSNDGFWGSRWCGPPMADCWWSCSTQRRKIWCLGDAFNVGI